MSLEADINHYLGIEDTKDLKKVTTTCDNVRIFILFSPAARSAGFPKKLIIRHFII